MGHDESITEYWERWYASLPAPETFNWATGATYSDLTALAEQATECTCDTMLLMRAGCQCGKSKQEQRRREET